MEAMDTTPTPPDTQPPPAEPPTPSPTSPSEPVPGQQDLLDPGPALEPGADPQDREDLLGVPPGTVPPPELPPGAGRGVFMESASALDGRTEAFIRFGKGKPPESIEEVIVFARKMVEIHAPKTRYNSMVITKLEEAELLWARGRGLS